MLHPYFNQFSKEAVKNQYRDNIKQLEWMHNKAVTTGKKVMGNTAAQLSEMINKMSANLAAL